jgi:hypothetical protein
LSVSSVNSLVLSSSSESLFSKASFAEASLSTAAVCLSLAFVTLSNSSNSPVLV